jgi:RNA polymerase sigma-70 factor (ECF subfamily)
MRETPRTPVDPARWLDEHGDHLYRFALARVGRPDAAEDLVQETLLAGLRAAANFGGRSTERTWLTGILKNKLIDRLRREKVRRELPSTGPENPQGPDGWLDGLYDHTGHWKSPPGAWGADPAALLERREFWEAFEVCRDRLPDRLREVLSLRVLDDVPPAEICQALDITASNLWTLLHRARLRLWECLDRKGLTPFPGGGKS